MQNTPNLIVILGPTATGKTRLAANLANSIKSEIISADSRQVYKQMDIGTGKDKNQYIVEGSTIPHHLVDIKLAGENYHVADFQTDFATAFDQIQSKGKIPILCGGTGMYIDAVLKNYQFTSIPNDTKLATELAKMSPSALKKLFQEFPSDYSLLADISTRKRLERAIQIAFYLKENPMRGNKAPTLNPLIFGLLMPVEKRRQCITERFHARLKEGLVQEVKGLLEQGISPEKLVFYGLEYRFVTEYLLGKMEYNEMVEKLNIAIHQFAKRQMTYFRKMERDGQKIYWLDAENDIETNLSEIKKQLWNPSKYLS